MIIPRLPGLGTLESTILQLRAEGKSYRAISLHVKLGPRLVHKIEARALKAAIDYLQRQAFLEGLTSQ